MESARLAVPEERIPEIRVQIVLDYTLQDCAKLEREIADLLVPGPNLRSLLDTIRDLRKQAERGILGLRFVPERIDEGNTE